LGIASCSFFILFRFLNILSQKDICNCFESKRQTQKIVGCTFFATHELVVLLASCVIFMRCKSEKKFRAVASTFISVSKDLHV